MFLRYNFLSIGWMLLIIILSFLPGKELPEVNIFEFDKIVHFVFYFLLFLFTAYGWRKQWQFARLQKIALAFVLVFCFLFGLSIEFGQAALTTDRHFDLHDVAANSMGALAALIIWKIVLQQFLIVNDE
jgi:VanZ family protein